MKRVTRAQLRGKPLEPICKKAHTTTHEYGLNDKRVFCCGVWGSMTDEPTEYCKVCKAFINNETPPKEET